MSHTFKVRYSLLKVLAGMLIRVQLPCVCKQRSALSVRIGYGASA